MLFLHGIPYRNFLQNNQLWRHPYDVISFTLSDYDTTCWLLYDLIGYFLLYNIGIQNTDFGQATKL